MTVAMVLSQLLLFSVGVTVKALVLRGEMPALTSPDEATPQFLLRFVPVVLSALVALSTVWALWDEIVPRRPCSAQWPAWRSACSPSRVGE